MQHGLCLAILTLALFAGCVAETPVAPVVIEAPELTLEISLDETTLIGKAIFSDGFVPESVEWIWGDGTSSNGNPATHEYRKIGCFVITVATFDEIGRSTTATQEIKLVDANADTPQTCEEAEISQSPESKPKPTTNLFLISPSPSRPGELVTISGKSGDTYFWETNGFGDQEGTEATYRFPEGRRTISATNDTTSGEIFHVVEGAPVSEWYHNFDGAPDDCSKLVPGPFTLEEGLITGFPMVDLDIILLVDTSFVAAHGENWRDVVDFIVEYGDQVYQEQLQLDIVVVDVFELPASYMNVTSTNTAGLGSDESQAVLDISRLYMDDYHPYLHRDLVYTLVGASIAGTIAGQAECIGGAGYKDAAYGWGEAGDLDDGALADPVGWFSYSEIKVILHEMGHILGAHHHYQYCGPPIATSLPGDVFGTCSLMTNVVDFASFEVSPQNKAAIRGWVNASGI